jgi:hypothetical protein
MRKIFSNFHAAVTFLWFSFGDSKRKNIEAPPIGKRWACVFLKQFEQVKQQELEFKERKRIGFKRDNE